MYRFTPFWTTTTTKIKRILKVTSFWRGLSTTTLLNYETKNIFGIWESTKENWVITTFSCFHIWYWFLYWVNWYSWPCYQLWFNRPSNFQREITSSTIQHIYWPSIGINSPLNYHLIDSEKAYFHCRGGAHISMEKVQQKILKKHKLLYLGWKCDVFLEIFWYFWAELE